MSIKINHDPGEVIIFTRVFPILVTVSVVINFATLLTFGIRKILPRHQASVKVHVTALLISCPLYGLFLVGLVVVDHLRVFPPQHTVLLFCNLFQFLTLFFRKSYMPIAIFALIDRLIKIRAHPTDYDNKYDPDKFCNVKVARICVGVSYGISAAISLYMMYGDGHFYADCYQYSHFSEYYIDLAYDILLECVMYTITIVTCVHFFRRAKKFSENEKNDVKEITDCINIDEDRSAAKAFIILSGIHFLTNVTVLEMIFPFLRQNTIWINEINFFVQQIRCICTASIFLFYWPSFKRVVKTSEKLNNDEQQSKNLIYCGLASESLEGQSLTMMKKPQKI